LKRAHFRSKWLIGEWLADDLGAKIGDTVEVRTRTRPGAMQTIELEIVGIISCPNPLINKGVGFLPLSVAQYDLDMEGAATEIVLSFAEGVDAERHLREIRPILTREFPDLTVLSWKELARDFVALADMKSTSSRILIFMIFVIAAIGISNTMLIAVYERVREIGMMRAMGMQDSSIRIAFLLEAGGIGIIGSLAGLIAGTLATYPIVRWGIDYSSLLGNMDVGYRIHGVYRGAWHPEAMITAAVIGVILSVAIALIPASRALKMKITDCLRYE
jgi:putative ABC transport system permease protein